jgi:L-amino acid N-acyltransferase YncA
MQQARLAVRMAVAADAPAIIDLHDQGIAGRVARFETAPRNVEDMAARIASHGHALPTTVVERDGHIIGWADAGMYRDRPWALDVAGRSAYVAREARAGRRWKDRSRRKRHIDAGS